MSFVFLLGDLHQADSILVHPYHREALDTTTPDRGAWQVRYVSNDDQVNISDDRRVRDCHSIHLLATRNANCFRIVEIFKDGDSAISKSIDGIRCVVLADLLSVGTNLGWSEIRAEIIRRAGGTVTCPPG